MLNVGLVLPPDVIALDMLKLGLPLLLCTLIDYESKSDCKSINEEHHHTVQFWKTVR
jgi:hypothetical protein